MISTWPSPQNVEYTLDISENTCVDPVINTEVIPYCSSGEGEFEVIVTISDLGSSSELLLIDSLGIVEPFYVQQVLIHLEVCWKPSSYSILQISG